MRTLIELIALLTCLTGCSMTPDTEHVAEDVQAIECAGCIDRLGLCHTGQDAHACGGPGVPCADCNDGNVCTGDVCLVYDAPGYPSCGHDMYNNTHDCGTDIMPGACDGNGHCCADCFSFETGTPVCKPACPSGLRCDLPDGACCQGCVTHGGACRTGNDPAACGVGGHMCEQCAAGADCVNGECVVAAKAAGEASSGFVNPCFIYGCDDQNACTTDTCTVSGCTHTPATGRCYYPGGDGQCNMGQCCHGYLEGDVFSGWECVQCEDTNPLTYDSAYDGCLNIDVVRCGDGPKLCATANDCYMNDCTVSECVNGHCSQTADPVGTSCFGQYHNYTYVGACDGACFCQP